jgi:Ca2+-binding RTX toxin-like protein
MFTRLGRTSLVTAIAVLVLLFTPGAAAPAGQIVIYGAQSGSTLKLKVAGNGNRIIVKGNMGQAKPKGCRITPNHMKAVCRVAGASSIELQMGPSGDLVKVKDRLPVPLTVHLGPGSDKFIGKGERDTCFSEGSRRNRCIGGGNTDVCITGPRNSDCVGGNGNDYCRTSTGSDGCWGGRGRDVCLMGPGMDGCHGGKGRDRLFGGADPDQLYGGHGNDYCNGGPGIGRSHACNRGPRH